MTTSLRRRGTAAAAGLVIGGLALSACSPAAQKTDAATPGASGEQVTINVRVWDEQLKSTYEKSFAEFTKKNPNIKVQVTYVAWAQYFDKLRTDIGAGQADDIFMMNGSYIEPYIKNKNIMEIGSDFSAQKGDWLQAAVDQYTYDGKLYGVPQLTDGGIALYYNEDLLTKAGVKPADLQNLKWDPSGNGDTLRPLAKKLTVDANGVAGDQPGFDGSKPGTWGYSAAQDLQGIYYNFLGSAGGQFQDASGKFTFDSPEGVAAFQYLVDMINKDKTSPGAENTNEQGDFVRDQFLQGKVAIFQSGVYNLKNVADGAKFKWGIAPLPAGPKGAVSVVNNTIVSGNAATKHKAETTKVLQWMGSAEGAKFIGSEGAGIPAVKSAAGSFNDTWKAKNIDASQFAKQGEMPSTRPPIGTNYSAAFKAWKPSFNEMFLGRMPVGEALKKAQVDANKAMELG